MALALLFCAGCNNNRLERLSSSNACDPDEDLASFELLESEEDVFELVSGGLPTDAEFETTGFTVTKVDGDIISTFNPAFLFTDDSRLNIVCAAGFVLDEPTAGGFAFSLAILNLEQELNQYDYTVDYDTQRSESGDPVFDTEGSPVLTPIGGTDILDALVNLGFEVNLYTFQQGNQQNVVFIVHARNIAENLTLRLRLQEIDEG